MVTAGTFSGNPAESTVVRPMFEACGPIWPTQPQRTSSISPGSTPVRSTSARSTCAPRSAGWIAASEPLRRPTGERTAPTTKASGIGCLLRVHPGRRPLLQERGRPLGEVAAEEEGQVQELGGVQRLVGRQVGEQGERAAAQPGGQRAGRGEPRRVLVGGLPQLVRCRRRPGSRNRRGRPRRRRSGGRSASGRAAACGARARARCATMIIGNRPMRISGMAKRARSVTSRTSQMPASPMPPA